MKEELATIHQNIRILLLKYPELRNPFKRKQAHIYYWREYEEIGELMFNLLMEKYPRLTSSETLSREIRKVQQENPELRAKTELVEQNLKKVEEYRENYRGQN